MSNGNPGIVASNFRQIGKSTLIGSVDLEIVGWKLAIKGCLWHRREDREWINFPAREWMGQDGKKVFTNFLEFTDKAVHARFQKAALDAVHAIVGGP